MTRETVNFLSRDEGRRRRLKITYLQDAPSRSPGRVSAFSADQKNPPQKKKNAPPTREVTSFPKTEQKSILRYVGTFNQ